ncbi:MerR family transcriptional regulator [Streptomyces alkaliterrae]|uniref:MerR family transcriptional regulator n=1 Tax=Streptomyces alkaliterrae TaxID=2213162 RepID=A0A5P0YMH4_9ACTN|nr:MerR family transcriptional regulator [Streptomyces alkaliterrae]MBB1252708.1 MerR family transcriptional regulator [Streptomyces alkaliterrae]MBB1258884.1 MerR family transcriptional regulator [Streptomyces alkaliterrae]MQS00867.1 MerR family transcriptional regulator [Streptomyces alkaliterrae]
MLSIGDFARFGGVSVRMLRHYDAVGLLRPARVDPFTGYRRYTADQLSRLNRIIALKELGFGLQQVAELLDERIGTAELRGMLRLRRSELAAAIAADTERLAQVEARLQVIESEGHMSDDDIVLKSVPPVRLAELSAVAEELEPASIGPVIQPLYARLLEELDRAGVAVSGPGVAYYEPLDDGAVRVHAGVTVAAEPDPAHPFDVVDLPGLESAATVVHHGSMDRVMPSIQRLARWIDGNGYRSTGIPREVSLSCEGGPENWVTELQEPVARV